MRSPSSPVDPAVLARIEGLELRARRIVEGYVSGLHRSPYRGFSLEFAEHREYTSGDDLRYLDWKVFGKTDKFYLKQYEEETNLVCYLVLDVSQSMQYRGPDSALSKLEYVQCLAASLAYLVLRQRDSVGLVTFDEGVSTFVPASGNPGHLKQLLQVMEGESAERHTDVATSFHDLAERFKRRGVVVILSDLFDDATALLKGLRHFRHRRHEVIVLHVLDGSEHDFPFEGVTLFRGLEAKPDVLTEPKSLRRAYLREFDSFLKRVRSGCGEQQADYVNARTDQPPDRLLAEYLSRRLN